MMSVCIMKGNKLVIQFDYQVTECSKLKQPQRRIHPGFKYLVWVKLLKHRILDTYNVSR